MRWLKRFADSKRGNVTLIFSLALVTIVGAAGGALDFGSAANARHDLQDAMDAAVLSGVRASSASMGTVASATFANNINGHWTVSSESYSSASSTTSSASASIITTSLSGTASTRSPTYALQLFGISNLNVNVSATAIASATQATVATPCIYVLDPSGSQALLVNSGAKVTAPNCEIDVKSTASPAAIFNSGSSLNFKKLCLKGSQVIQNSTIVANLALKCAAQDDPYAGALPTPASSSCTVSNGNYNNATVNLTPGVYCGWFNFNNSSAKVNFAPGVYVIKGGGWNVNGGTWTGSGVTFYFADTSKIQFNSGISATLSAPTTGTYKNLLFYEASGLSKSDFIFNDSVANNLTGLIWLPSRTVTFNSNSGVASDALTMVVWRLILDKTNWNLGPAGGSTSSATSTTSNVRLIH